MPDPSLNHENEHCPDLLLLVRNAMQIYGSKIYQSGMLFVQYRMDLSMEVNTLALARLDFRP